MNNRKHYHWNTHINQTHYVFLIPNYSPHHQLSSIHFFLFSALSLFPTNTPQSRNTQRRHIEHLQHPLQVLPILHRYIQRLLPIARYFHDLSLLLHLLPHSPHSLPLLRLHRRLRLVSTFHAHLIHRIVRKHRVFIRVSVRVHQRRGAVRVVRQHLHQHRVRRRRRLDIRDFRQLDDHVVLRVCSGRRRRRSRRLVVVEPATRSRVAQFDGSAVDDARGNGETGKLLAVHFFESGFGFVAGAELDETVAFADGSAGLAHDLWFDCMQLRSTLAPQKERYLSRKIV